MKLDSFGEGDSFEERLGLDDGKVLRLESYLWAFCTGGIECLGFCGIQVQHLEPGKGSQSSTYESHPRKS